MSEVRRLTPSEARRLVEALGALLDFAAANVPAALAKRQTGWENASAARELRPNTARNVSAVGVAACWAYDVISRNYEGDAAAIAPAVLLLAEIGLLERDELPVHPTTQ
jgi:hypothetical protein